jgi:predicted RNA-binding protein
MHSYHEHKHMSLDGDSSRYWIIVASRDHVQRGLSEGICQADHGKEAAIKRMKKGDGLLFYSPKEKFGEDEKCRKFTAIGDIPDDLVYQVHLQDGFSPFRRRVAFRPCAETPIEPLIPELSFIKNKKSWGYLFRFGMFQIPREDFVRIVSVMSPAMKTP